jgi:hypothetical protein
MGRGYDNQLSTINKKKLGAVFFWLLVVGSTRCLTLPTQDCVQVQSRQMEKSQTAILNSPGKNV